MISCSVRCYPRLVWVATPHRLSVLHQYSSSRWLATQSVPSQKLTLMQKYERFLEKKCPKCYKVHRMVVDGCKACVADVKTYYIIRKDLNAGKISMADLSRKQLECYIQCPSEIVHLLILIVLLNIPIIGDALIFLVIFFPRYILTRHFWSKDQKREYWADTMNKVASTHFAAIVAELPSQKHIDFPVPYEKLGDIKVTKLDDLSFTQVFHLSRVHRLFPLSGAKNLIWRAEALRHLDNLMIQELSIIDEMKPDELYTHMNIRRLNFDGLSESQIRDALKQWIKNSPSICVNPSLYLHAPVFLQYTKQLIEQIREQEKDHKI